MEFPYTLALTSHLGSICASPVLESSDWVMTKEVQPDWLVNCDVLV